ncbi:hypothetical protein [Xenorhabdus bovienii]|uniref:hypothetical protein n=1 Tax=Xenorhabdus bovienii TaxID=40576 RepID=UPI0023B32326|nr:hypothetical protein [Xenorhabdus bovienii]MDE9463081.1 hypothetical protein [Xenorhabdus bovienii]
MEARIDHRTLEAQRDEALELAEKARERGDKCGELERSIKAIALNREPLPQLSVGAWWMKERSGETAPAVDRERTRI